MRTNKEFQDILNDNIKRIEGDIVWQNDEDHSPSVEFRADVISNAGYPLMVRGSYNPLIPTLFRVWRQFCKEARLSGLKRISGWRSRCPSLRAGRSRKSLRLFYEDRRGAGTLTMF